MNIVQAIQRSIGRSLSQLEGGEPFLMAVSVTEDNTPVATVNQDGTVNAAALWDWGFWDGGNWA